MAIGVHLSSGGAERTAPLSGAISLRPLKTETPTLNEILRVFLRVSVALQVTAVFPSLNLEPEAGLQTVLTTPSTASVATGRL